MSLKFRQTWAWNGNDIRIILDAIQDAPKPIIHVCSGSSNIGEYRIDAYKVNLRNTDGAKRFTDDYRSIPNILGDMFHLPFKSGIAGTVICDPPYDDKLFKNGEFDKHISPLINELVRVLKPKGKLLMYAPWIFKHHTIELKELIPSNVGANRSYYKVLSISIKNNAQLGDYC